MKGSYCRVMASRRMRMFPFHRSPVTSTLLVLGLTAFVVVMFIQPQQNAESNIKIIDTYIDGEKQQQQHQPHQETNQNAESNIKIIDTYIDGEKQQQQHQPQQKTNQDGCQARDSVVFIKTHKCASSTVQRIFLRYGKSHNLTFALPKVANYIGHPMSFNKLLIPKYLRTPDDLYNMIVVHTRFNYENMAKVVSKDARFVTILREPMSQMESQWDYYDLEEFYKMNISTWSKLPYNKVSNWRVLDKKHGVHQMMFDLGHGSVGDLLQDELNNRFKRMAEQFNLVMIAEKFDESLVLLKHIMCWTTEDIAYLKINFRQEKNKTLFSEETKNRLLKLDKPDVLLYDFFKKIFQEKVEAFGIEKMKIEIEKLKSENERIANKCIDKAANLNEVSDFLKPKNNKVQTWMVKNNSTECLDLVINEIDFIDKLRKRQLAWNFKENHPYKGNVKRLQNTDSEVFKSLFTK